MLQPTPHTDLPAHGPTRGTPPPMVEAAKWPPDDADLPDDPPGGGGGVPAGGGGGDMLGPGEGDFKSGRFKPVAVLVAIVAVLGAAAFFFLGAKQSAEEIDVPTAQEKKKAIMVLPKAEQVAKWRELANPKTAFAGQGGDELKRTAIKQLAYLEDPEGVNLAIESLKDPDVTVRAQAATALAWYGSPAADAAKAPLMKLLKESDAGEAPQVAWTLVELGASEAFDDIMRLYRKGHLSKVQRLDGVRAFDPDKIVGLISLDKLASMAGDESAAVRQLVATVLSREGDPKYTDQLIALVQDADIEVARQAASGLGKIGSEKAVQPLLSALEKTDKDSREKYYHALRDGVGTQGLVLAIRVADKADTERKRWFRTEQIFKLIHELADPRGADALMKYIEGEPHIHWETEAAVAMAEVGDVRAVPSLAKRMRMDPLKIYSDKTDWEQKLKRDDKERVVAARMIADLAYLHPDKLEQIAEQAEDAVNFWINELPSPHANGLRALARMKTQDKDILKEMRDWADPDAELPLEGQQPPMPEEWVIAQSALRYVGMLKDKDSWKTLEKQMKRRPDDINATMDSLMGGGLAILGMTLRAVGRGASQGFAEWGDPKAFDLMMEYIEDDKENEQSREAACQSLAWVAEKEQMEKVIEKLEEWNDTGDDKQQFRRACLLETLITRPMDGTQEKLLGLVAPETAIGTRHQAARALGKAGFGEDIEGKLFEKMKDDALMVDAALALVLGGSVDTAKRAVAMFSDEAKKPALDDLKDLYYKSFGYWSHEDLEQGHIFRWVDNAQGMALVSWNDTPQEWARVLLEKQFDNLQFDNGPHSFTRVVLRVRLFEMAKGNDEAKRAGAIRTLRFMKEQGVLATLRDMKGPAGKLASEAYHELMNPKVAVDVKIPEE